MSTLSITGNIVRDPELRFTPTGKAVANLTVAESRRRRTADGNGWEDAEPTFWPVAIWGDYAEHVAESLVAGARVVVVGRTRTQVWTQIERERAGQELRRLEVAAAEAAPSLRWATAKVVKVERRDGEAPVEDERRSSARLAGPGPFAGRGSAPRGLHGD
jgi:single-strand DNA-binding protein